MIIKQNKKQTVLYALITLPAVVALSCFVIFDLRNLPHDPAVFLDNAFLYWVLKGLCLVGAFFAAVGDVYLFKQIFSKEPLIEICDDYFYDNSSAISLGKIVWSDMEKVYIKGGFLNIILKNPDKYFENKNWLQMLMIKGNLKLGYGDACISAERFKKDAKRFEEEFTKRKTIDM